MVTVPCAALLAPNGNNLVLQGDIVRRALVRRIDPQMDRPELRAFDQDLLAEGRERRGNLVADCHTIMAAYLQAGQPSQGVALKGGKLDAQRLGIWLSSHRDSPCRQACAEARRPRWQHQAPALDR
jgi:hypothetical protein